MFKKIVEFFTGKKPETNSAQAPYKVEPPADTTPLVYHPTHPACPGPIPVKVEPLVNTTPIPYVPEPPLAVETAPAPKAAAEKKKRTFEKKPVAAKASAAKAPAKPRAKKTP